MRRELVSWHLGLGRRTGIHLLPRCGSSLQKIEVKCTLSDEDEVHLSNQDRDIGEHFEKTMKGMTDQILSLNAVASQWLFSWDENVTIWRTLLATCVQC